MGSIGGLLGMSGGAGGTGFSTNPGTNGQQIGQAYTGQQAAMGQQQNLLNALQGQNGIQNQSNVYNQLQGVVSGQGPNPAQAQLAQATGANVANQAALMAGQRGAGANVGLMARQAAQQGANIQQQAAGQGATMQAQQSLNALGQAGNMAGSMAANQIGQTNANVQAQQNEQGILQGANSAQNNIQGQLANTTLGGQQKVIGGLMQGAGAAMGMADGGPVSAFGPQSMFGNFVNGQQQQNLASMGTPNTDPFKMSSGKSSSPSDPMAGATNDIQDASGVSGGAMSAGADAGAGGLSDLAMLAVSKGGKIPAMVSPGERFLKPNEAKAVAQGKVNPTKVGEKIQGQAKVKGDSTKNDTVRKDLEVGGIVIPRSIENSKNPGAEAKKFVDKYMAKKRMKK